MEIIMVATSKRQQVAFPQGKAHFLSDVPAVDPTELAMLALDDRGVIQNCNQTCEQVFGYRQDELTGHHVSTLLPQLKDTDLVLEDRVNSRLAFLCHCAIPFHARRCDGNSFTSELFINRLSGQSLVVLVRSLEEAA
jgi:PAS domain S-box-containing protein